MEFNAYVESLGLNPETLTPSLKATLQNSWRASQKDDAGGGAKIPAGHPAAASQAGTHEPVKHDDGGSFAAKMSAIDAENERIEYINASTIEAMQRHTGNPEKCKKLREMRDAAVADQKTDRKDWQLALMRASRYDAPNPFQSSGGTQVTESVLEAAICLTHKVPGTEQRFSPQILDAAHANFRRGLGLKELIRVAAERNANYRGSSYDEVAMCRAAFGRGGSDGFGLSASGPSTISVPGILSNVANKSLASSFLFTEQAWRKIARVRSANDFKTMTTYRLTGSNTFEKVAPGGKIKDGSLSELTYTNKVETYGKKLGIDRRDIRNDDLGALMGATDELGRGAGDSLNTVFWTEWLSDSAFFPTDGSYANYDAGATDSVLSVAGLENADYIFRVQTKPDGTLMGIEPKILLVPTGLRTTARTLMNSTALIGQGASAAPVPGTNIWAGMFEAVDSVYLTQTALGGSATAWYLLADPLVAAAIEVAFLDGIESPTIETSEFDFDQLGLSMRAWMDFGVAKQEYRAAVKLKGAA